MSDRKSSKEPSKETPASAHRPSDPGSGPRRSPEPGNEFMQSALRTNLFLRTLSLARLSLATSSRYATDRFAGLFSDEEQAAERIKQGLLAQSRAIASELGQLKGSVMKVGQMISVYGEHFLPPEANAILKTLQCQAPPLDWNRMKEIFVAELGEEALSELEIDPVPKASASIGQVHVGRPRSTGGTIALKIQYPGVDRAVQSDLQALKVSLSLVRSFSQIPHLDRIFLEVQEMLEQELDYRIEADNLEFFRGALADDDRYVVPNLHRRFCARRVLATGFIEGVALDGPEVLSLPQERRDKIADALLDLYFRELFELRTVQTDPHFGNYQVILAEGADGPDRLVLFDFGAVRRLDETFTSHYRDLTLAALARDSAGVIEAARAIGFLESGDPPELLIPFADLCFLAVEPYLVPGAYDWRGSDLLKRLSAQLNKVIRSYEFRPPPREIFFLDRKSSGVFTALTVLGARTDARAILDRHLSK